MATLAFGAVGTAIAGPIGGMIGAGIGSYIDQAFLFPAIFDEDRSITNEQHFGQEKLSDFNMTYSSEGSPMSWGTGRRMVVPGTIIWMSKPYKITTVIVHQTEQGGGGKGGGGGSTTSTSTSYTHTWYVDVAVAIAEGTVDRVARVFANNRTIWRDRGGGDTVKSGWVQSVHRYRGTTGQSADSWIDAAVDGTIPAFRKTSYIVLKKLCISKTGNQMPRFSLGLDVDEDAMLTDAIAAILSRGGVEAGEYDISSTLDSIKAWGIVLSGPQPPIKALETLALAYDLMGYEKSGKLHIIKSSDSTSITVDSDHLAAHLYGEQPPPMLEINDKPDDELASQVSVTAGKTGFTNNTTSAYASRQLKTDGPHRKITLDAQLGSGQVRVIADRVLWKEWEDRRSATLYLPPSYIDITPTDLLSIEDSDGEGFTGLVTKVDMSPDFRIRVEVILRTVETIDFVDDDTEDDDDGDDPYTGGTGVLATIDGPALQESQNVIPGFYMAACLEEGSEEWDGLVAYISDDDSTFSYYEPFPHEAYIGKTTDALGDMNESEGRIWDRINTVNVDMYEGELTTRTEAEILNGANRAFIYADGSWELIGFVTATLEGDGTYTLSTLLRGIRDTFDEMDDHAIDDTFVLLAEAYMAFRDFSIGEIGETKYFKPVPAFVDESDVSSFSDTLDARNLRPFPVTRVQGSRDASNNLTITWKAVTRSLVPIFRKTTAPLQHPTDITGYEIDVMDGVDVVRTITISGANTETASYTAAQQSADGFTPGNVINAIDFEIYQMSSIYGRGRKKEATL